MQVHKYNAAAQRTHHRVTYAQVFSSVNTANAPQSYIICTSIFIGQYRPNIYTSMIHIIHSTHVHICKCIITLSAAEQRSHHRVIYARVFSSVNPDRTFKHKYLIQNGLLCSIIQYNAHTASCSNTDNDAVRNVLFVDARFSRSHRRCDGIVRIYSETPTGNRTAKELHSGRG